MALSDKERLTTFALGALLGCFVVAGLISRRNAVKSERELLSKAPVPAGIQPLPGAVPEMFRRGKILHFREHAPRDRTWILQYYKNYSFVQIDETPSTQSSTGGVSTFRFLAADRLLVRLKPDVSIKDFQAKLTPLGLHTRENYKKKGILIVGLVEVGIGKLESTLEQVRALDAVISVEFDRIESGRR